jgi:hypothetical protein
LVTCRTKISGGEIFGAEAGGGEVEREVIDNGLAHRGVLAGFGTEDFLAFFFHPEPLGVALGNTTLEFFLVFPALAFEAQFFSLQTDATQVGELLGGAEDGPPLDVGIGRDEFAMDEPAEGEDSGQGRALGERNGAGPFLKIVELLDELGGPVPGILVAKPVFKAALAPVAEVLFGDRACVEVLPQDGLDFGEIVEPGDEAGAKFAIGEAAVELFADGAREAGDFSDSGHREVDG